MQNRMNTQDILQIDENKQHTNGRVSEPMNNQTSLKHRKKWKLLE